MPASPKTPSAGSAADAFAWRRDTWGDYFRTVQGAAAAAVALVLLILITQELNTGSPIAAAPELGRRGLAPQAAETDAAEDLRLPRRGGHAVSADEVKVLHKNIAEHRRQVEGLKMENGSLKATLARLTGNRMPPWRAEPMTQEEIQDLLASPHLQNSDIKHGEHESAGALNGGSSGTDFPGFYFYPGMDFDGSDLHHYAELEDDLPQLAERCKKAALCKAFNSQGWLKNSIEPRHKWYKWTTTRHKGIFIKREYADLE